MRRILITSGLLFCLTGVWAQTNNPNFDQALATKLGADDYGMKMYVLVMLKTGSAAITDKNVIDSIFKGHFTNMIRLTNEGKLIVAGPMGKNDRNYRGLFILNVPKVEDARIIVNTDPAVKSKVLDAEFLPWYGSAALSEYLPFHKKIEKKKM